jgi:hypothetical protein
VRILWLGVLAVIVCAAQSTPSFEAASVKPSKSSDPPNSNFPLGPGDVYTPNGGLFRSTGQPLVLYIYRSLTS